MLAKSSSAFGFPCWARHIPRLAEKVGHEALLKLLPLVSPGEREITDLQASLMSGNDLDTFQLPFPGPLKRQIEPAELLQDDAILDEKYAKNSLKTIEACL